MPKGQVWRMAWGTGARGPSSLSASNRTSHGPKCNPSLLAKKTRALRTLRPPLASQPQAASAQSVRQVYLCPTRASCEKEGACTVHVPNHDSNNHYSQTRKTAFSVHGGSFSQKGSVNSPSSRYMVVLFLKQLVNSPSSRCMVVLFLKRFRSVRYQMNSPESMANAPSYIVCAYIYIYIYTHMYTYK